MRKILSSFLEKKKSMLLTIKLGILYNMFTYMLTLQNRSHYLYFTGVGNEDQKSQVISFVTWLINQILIFN